MNKHLFRKIYSTGNMNYYHVDISGLPSTYLAIEIFDAVNKATKRWFRKGYKLKPEIITTGLRMMPINSLVLWLITNAVMMEPYTYKLDVNDEKLDIYKEWDAFDIKDLKDAFKNHIKEAGGESNYTFPVVPKNKVVKGYVSDNYEYFATESNGAMSKTHWLVRFTPYGFLHFIAVEEVGTEASSVTIGVNSVMMDRELMKTIMKEKLNND